MEGWMNLYSRGIFGPQNHEFWGVYLGMNRICLTLSRCRIPPQMTCISPNMPKNLQNNKKLRMCRGVFGWYPYENRTTFSCPEFIPVKQMTSKFLFVFNMGWLSHSVQKKNENLLVMRLPQQRQLSFTPHGTYRRNPQWSQLMGY